MSDGGNVRLQSMPFTFYDVIVYLGPGILTTWALTEVTSNLLDVSPNEFAKAVSAHIVLVGVPAIDIATAIVIALVAAYTVGLLIGLFASLTVEKLSIIYFGYPSGFVCKTINFGGPLCERYVFEKMRESAGKPGPVFIQLLCFPLVLFIWVAGLFAWFVVLLKPLPETIVSMLKERFFFLSGYKINLDANRDWFRFVCFYVINNNTVAFLRMYNYLTLYGFLRNMTFILLVSTFSYTYIYLQHIGDEDATRFALSAIASWFACCGAFCGFLKFYRRYTEEAILAFVLMRIDQADKASNQARI